MQCDIDSRLSSDRVASKDFGGNAGDTQDHPPIENKQFSFASSTPMNAEQIHRETPVDVDMSIDIPEVGEGPEAIVEQRKREKRAAKARIRSELLRSMKERYAEEGLDMSDGEEDRFCYGMDACHSDDAACVAQQSSTSSVGYRQLMINDKAKHVSQLLRARRCAIASVTDRLCFDSKQGDLVAPSDINDTSKPTPPISLVDLPTELLLIVCKHLSEFKVPAVNIHGHWEHEPRFTPVPRAKKRDLMNLALTCQRLHDVVKVDPKERIGATLFKFDPRQPQDSVRLEEIRDFSDRLLVGEDREFIE